MRTLPARRDGTSPGQLNQVARKEAEAGAVVNRILDHARAARGAREVVALRADGGLGRTDYSGVHVDARRVSGAIGIGQGDRVATLASNNVDHLAFWYGTMGIGAVLHTLNLAIHPDQFAWMFAVRPTTR